MRSWGNIACLLTQCVHGALWARAYANMAAGARRGRAGSEAMGAGGEHLSCQRQRTRMHVGRVLHMTVFDSGRTRASGVQLYLAPTRSCN